MKYCISRTFFRTSQQQECRWPIWFKELDCRACSWFAFCFSAFSCFERFAIHVYHGYVLKSKKVNSLTYIKANKRTTKFHYYTAYSLWKIWLVESIQSIHNSLWTWHDKCNICCRYCIYHVKFNVWLVTKPLLVFSETKWLNASLLFLRMNYVKNVK